MGTRFRILSEIRDIETIASGRGVYIRRYLKRAYGHGRWRKMRGIATVELADSTICEAEIHGMKPMRKTSLNRSSNALNAWFCVDALTFSTIAKRARNVFTSVAAGSPVSPACLRYARNRRFQCR